MKMDNVARINMLARQKGMSYGQYQAMLYEQRGYQPEKRKEPEDEAEKRFCAVCGKELSKYANKHAKTCGIACRTELNRRRSREYYREKIAFKPDGEYECAYCKGKFVPTRRYQRFCGSRCQEANKRAVRRGETVDTGMPPGMANRSYGTGECVICGGGFTKKSARQLTCCAGCRKEYAEKKGFALAPSTGQEM